MASELLRRTREFEEQNRSLADPERPVFHFIAPIGWMNDPNGFSVYRGEYHLFFQYYPYSNNWGPMHWGHAKTRDFIHWEYLPAALAPDTEYDKDGCWSGSAAELDDGRQLLLYTGRRVADDGQAYQVQCLAVGDGRDYEKYDGNPVLTAENLPEGSSPHDFRDPKLWREPDGTFRAVAVTRTEDGSGAALLYRSPDGFSWAFERVLDRCRNEYGNMWECPDFFPLDGKQVLLVSPIGLEARDAEFHAGFGAIALLGHYDAVSGAFAREAVRTLDHGPDFYAAQTMEAPDGRRIMIAWMRNWETAFNKPPAWNQRKCFGSMTFPRELNVRDGRLIQNPAREIEKIRGEKTECKEAIVSGENALPGIRGRVFDLTLRVRPADPDGYERFQLGVAADGARMASILYLPGQNLVRIDRTACGLPAPIENVREFAVRDRGGALDMRVLMDGESVELFVNGGEQAATFLIDAPPEADGIRFKSSGRVLMDAEKFDLLRE